MFEILVFIVLIISILLILKGSDWLTDSLIPVANKLGTSYIAVTTILASFMISTPEIFSSLYSFFLGHEELGIGVLIGSVMINIGLTLGLSASIKPLKIEKDILIRDGIFLVIVSFIVMIFGSDLRYDRTEGIVLILMFIPYMLNVWWFEKSRNIKTRENKVESLKTNMDLFGAQYPILKLEPGINTFVFGALFLFIGSYFFSWSLIESAKIIKIPEVVIGIILGAIGTGMPNIAAGIQGTLKGYEDAALTETFGSNIFTLLVTLGLFITLSPMTIPLKVFYYDLNWMVLLHVLLVAFIFKGFKYREESLTRYEGFILVVFYLTLIIFNVLFFH
ncbi:MAG: sodium:calcium antiporter [Candidatus Woesearchaeota archaeon]